MSFICGTSCGTPPVPTPSYFNCIDNMREFGSNHFALIKCDYQFVDITDDAEWVAAVGTGDIQISPPGKLVALSPTQTVAEIEGCRREVSGNIEHVWDFTTEQVADDLADYTYFKNLFKNSAGFRIVLFHCDGRIVMEDLYVDQANGGTPDIAGISPGFIFSVPVVPHLIENTELRVDQWVTQFKIKRGRDTGVLCAASLPDVYQALAPQ